MAKAPSRSALIALASAGSFLALAAAYTFQYLGGLAPCHLCWLQRYPHFAALGLGLLALMIRLPVVARKVEVHPAPKVRRTEQRVDQAEMVHLLKVLFVGVTGLFI